MNKQLHLIYVPGLGDRRVTGQRIVVSAWRIWGVEAELFHMHWSDAEAWESKLERLLDRITTLANNKHSIALVGASAGASAVINAYADLKDKIVGCVLIAAKVNHPESIGKIYRKENPAFIASAEACQRALRDLSSGDKRRILSRYARSDGVVTSTDSRIEGCNNQIVPSLSHAVTIASQITIGAPSFIHFLKDLSRQSH